MNASRIAALAVLPVLAVAARADLQQPGSLLVFPLVDGRVGTTCVLTLTNTNPVAAQPLLVEVAFVSDCLQFNRTYMVPALDTEPVLVSTQFPFGTQGYAYAFAKDALGLPVSANHLIGSALVLESATAKEFQYAAVSFASPLPAGTRTDVDEDLRRDLDGVEYARSPEELLFPRFLGQSAAYGSELVLVNMTGGGDFQATVSLRVWNDNRMQFSVQHAFRCWSRVRLNAISGLFDNSFLVATPNDSTESAFGRETGWFLVDGLSAKAGVQVLNDPAILGILLEPAFLSSAMLPFARGTQGNGVLEPIPGFVPTVPSVPGNGGISGG